MATSVIDILEQLESNNSRLFKEEVLECNSSNELLSRIFQLVGDPYINFYVNKFKLPPAMDEGVEDNAIVEKFLNFIVDDLSTRTITGNAAKDAVVTFFSCLSQPQQKWCLRILLKNLRCGVSDATVNKTWPGLITSFSVQLAESLSVQHEPNNGVIIRDVVEYPIRVEPKLDGLRCVAVKHNGEVTMFTRNGSVVDTLPTIRMALEAAPWDDFVLDGEAMGRDWNESASVVMSHKKNKDDSGMIYNVFDAMHFDDWRDQINGTNVEDRVNLVSELVAAIGNQCVLQVEGITANNEQQLMSFYASCMEKGYEGVMLKILSAPYVFKRTDAVKKMKPVATYEGVIVGSYDGRRGSKREGMWGGFEVLLPNGVITKVGGGYTDKLKAEIDLDPESYIGKIVEMEGQPDPMTKTGLTVDGKVRFPVFCRFRDSSDVDPKIIAAYDTYTGL